MSALPSYFVKTSLKRLDPHLSGAARKVFKLPDWLDAEGKASLADLALKLFPLEKPAEAKRMLKTLQEAFNQQAEAHKHPLRLVISTGKAAELWFEGQAELPLAQPTPDLNAIPENQRIEQRGLILTPPPTVVLLTFNEHEHRAVLAAFGDGKPPKTQTRDGVTYNLLGLCGGMDIVHAISEAGSGGLGAAQQRAGDAIRAWQPKAIIAVGIAFGMDERKQSIGDVLVSTQLRLYELARVNANGSLTPRDSLKTHYAPEAIGGEMEGSGLYVAAHAAKVDWVVIKAICDFADGNKGKNKEQNQRLAATNAAQVLKAALALGNLYSGDGPASGEAPPQPQGPPSARCQGLRDLHEIPKHLLEEHPAALPTSLRKDRLLEPAQDNTPSVAVLEYLLDWAGNPKAPALFALLGEYGMGKTITCQRLALALEQQREADPASPLPLYFDLRNVTGLDKAVPGQEAIIEECIRRGWHKDGGAAYDFAAIARLIDQGAVLILDGLDEVLVKLNEADGQTFTNQLLRLLGDSRTRLKNTPAAKLLISCRTHYFRSLRDQQTHFTGQERGEYGADAYLALLLLPFGEDKVRRYLANALPEADPDRLLETIRAIHNLEELTSRPYMLKLVAEFIPELEDARAAGKTVHGATLYRNMVNRWLDRDKGKHHIKPEHKLRLAAHLAAELWRTGRRVFQVGEMEDWFHVWLDSQPNLHRRYGGLHKDQLEEDLRTATFLTRQDADKPEDCGFRFAHTSLQEFFLADYLLAAIRDKNPASWAMARPSRETLDFLGQMLAEAEDPALPATLQNWRKPYRPHTSELLLDYALLALAKGWPVPVLHGMDLSGADLRGWTIGIKSPPAPLFQRGEAHGGFVTGNPLPLQTGKEPPLSQAADSLPRLQATNSSPLCKPPTVSPL